MTLKDQKIQNTPKPIIYDDTKNGNENDTSAAVEFLESYLFCKKMLDMNKYERAFFSFSDIGGETSCDDVFLKSRVMRVREFVMNLPNCREKMFLYYHYIHGNTVERCAEIMDISRRSGFRVKKAAIALAARHLPHDNANGDVIENANGGDATDD